MNFPGATVLADVSPQGRVLLSTSQGTTQETVGVRDGDPVVRNLTLLDQTWPMDLSSDGKMILFTSGLLSATYNVYLRRTDDSPPVRLGEGLGESLSPDGKWALADLLSTPSQLIAIPTGAAKHSASRRPACIISPGPNGFPDSKQVLFAASQPGYASKLWVQSVSPPEAPRAFTGEGVELQGKGLTPDGRAVAAKTSDGSYALYPLDGGTPRPLPGIEPGELFIRWSGDGKEFYANTTGSLPAVFYKIDLSTGKKQKWREFAPSDRAGVLGLNWALLTPDGKQAVYFYNRYLTELQLVDGLR